MEFIWNLARRSRQRNRKAIQQAPGEQWEHTAAAPRHVTRGWIVSHMEDSAAGWLLEKCFEEYVNNGIPLLSEG